MVYDKKQTANMNLLSNLLFIGIWFLFGLIVSQLYGTQQQYMVVLIWHLQLGSDGEYGDKQAGPCMGRCMGGWCYCGGGGHLVWVMS